MTRDRHEPGEHWVSGVPEGTEIIHNPTRQERERTIGFPDESEFLERHGMHFHPDRISPIWERAKSADPAPVRTASTTSTGCHPSMAVVHVGCD